MKLLLSHSYDLCHFDWFTSRTGGAVESKIDFPCVLLQMYIVYRVSQEECARLREGVPYVKVYRYNPKHLFQS